MGQCGLPDFPWRPDRGARATAATHPDGLIDLSVGAPVVAVDPLIRDAVGVTIPRLPGDGDRRGTARRGRRRQWCVATRNLAWRRTDPAVIPGWRRPSPGSDRHWALVAAIFWSSHGSPTDVRGERAILAVHSRCAPTNREQCGLGPTLVFLNSPSNPTGAVMGVG